jgi:hypothetical protein
MPAPASTPNTKTTTQIATRAGRLDTGHSIPALPNGLVIKHRSSADAGGRGGEADHVARSEIAQTRSTAEAASKRVISF